MYLSWHIFVNAAHSGGGAGQHRHLYYWVEYSLMAVLTWKYVWQEKVSKLFRSSWRGERALLMLLCVSCHGVCLCVGGGGAHYFQVSSGERERERLCVCEDTERNSNPLRCKSVKRTIFRKNEIKREIPKVMVPRERRGTKIPSFGACSFQ